VVAPPSDAQLSKLQLFAPVQTIRHLAPAPHTILSQLFAAVQSMLQVDASRHCTSQLLAPVQSIESQAASPAQVAEQLFAPMQPIEAQCETPSHVTLQSELAGHCALHAFRALHSRSQPVQVGSPAPLSPAAPPVPAGSS
jgi:hypothetical protein